MQTIIIDLKKNPEIADLVTDKQPGDRILLHTSIKQLNDQTLELTIEEAEEGKDPDADENPPGGNEGSAATGENMDTPQVGATPNTARDIAGGELAAGA